MQQPVDQPATPPQAGAGPWGGSPRDHLLPQQRSFTSRDSWKDFLDDTFPALAIDYRQRGDFQARVVSLSVGELGLAAIATRPQVVERTRAAVSRGHGESVKALWPVKCPMQVTQDRREVVVAPGQMVLCDTSRPYRVALEEEAEFLVLRMPSRRLRNWAQLGECLTGRSFSGLTLDASLSTLRTLLMAPGQGTDRSEVETVLNAATDMLAAALARGAARLGDDPSREAGRFASALELIRQRALDPAFTPDTLAVLLHMSKRSLYLLFQAQGLSPAQAITDARFDYAREALQALHQADRYRGDSAGGGTPGTSLQAAQTISRIALDCGFSSLAAFSRAFRNRYGVSPSGWREG